MTVSTDYIQTQEHTADTFQNDKIRKWVEPHLDGKVLNSCSGPSRLHHRGDVVRNDMDPEIQANTHVDVAKLGAEYSPNSFDTIVFDPPWSLYQANMRYDGRHVHKDAIEIDTTQLPQELDRGKSQIGHARLAKDGFDYLLNPGGKVIQLSYSGTCMPSRLQYERLERVMFDPLGEGKTLIGSVDRKTQTKL